MNSLPEKYHLVEADLARHVRDVGYWHLPYGTLLGGKRPPKPSTGVYGHRHTRTSKEAPNYKSAKEAEEVIDSMSSVDWSSIKDRLHSDSPTEREQALEEFNSHTLQVNAAFSTVRAEFESKRMKASIEASRFTVERKVISAKARLTAAEPALKAKELGADYTKHLASKGLTQAVVSVGTRVLGAFAAYLTSGEAQHFAEQFHAIADSPMLETAITVAAMAAVLALLRAVRKRIVAHHQLKIAKAQGRVQS